MPTRSSYDRDHTVLRLAASLEHVYRRDTVRINANVAPATHGETVEEILGSGDAGAGRPAVSAQAGAADLRQRRHAERARARRCEVRVNDVLWEEVPTLYGRGPARTGLRPFTSTDDEHDDRRSSATASRARGCPAGTTNVRATYRKGLGVAGNVRAAAS